MKEKSRHMLITAEILGFFMIIIGLLGLLTDREVFRIAAFVVFGLIILVAAIFAVFATMAVRQDRAHIKKRK